MATDTLFRVYTDMPQRVPPGVWRAIRWVVVALALGEAVLAMTLPSLGLKLFWGVYVPSLPLVFLVAPALWRNICPMASLNQIPRTLGFTRGLAVPLRVQQFAPLISAALFLLIVPFRKAMLDHNGTALGLFILLMLTLAFTGGVLFKGKSGWCAQFCPMLQVERFYGQSPLFVLRNAHCNPCVGCSKNCYDFNPTAAYLADLHDQNPRLQVNRKIFAGAMPWLIAAFFTQPYVQHLTVLNVLGLYGRILLFVAAGIGLFLLLEQVTPFDTYHVVLLHVVAAITLFYWFVAPLALSTVGLGNTPIPYAIDVVVVALAAVWIWRAWPRERRFLVAGYGAPARVADSVLRLNSARRGEQAEVSFREGPTVLAQEGETLLDIAEANGVKLESGCRMGMCGADPVRIVSGAEHLSAVLPAESATLERLGLGSSCRMACCARVQGPVSVVTAPDQLEAEEEEAAPAGRPTMPRPPGVDEVVIVGSGVAGVTTATELRKLQPDIGITLIGHESYDFYNRMAISKLVSESTSIDKLYLMPKGWHEQREIRFLRGVTVRHIDRRKRLVVTDDGREIPYDRLVLATGAQSRVLPIKGFGVDGTFVLRTIDDGVEIQQYVRRCRCRNALVVGGGLLGLEAAHAISMLGVRVYVLDQAPWPLPRQLDQPAGLLLHGMLSDLGIDVLPATTARQIIGDERVEAVELSDGRTLPMDLCLIAAGISPEAEIAREAGLAVYRGVVVNDEMMTSDPAIYAVGDVVDHRGKMYGLWPASVDQAHIAAVNLLGGDERYKPVVPPTKLKVAGIDLLSVGQIEAKEPGESEIRIEDRHARQYRKLVLRGGELCGGILMGKVDLADVLTGAVEEGLDVSDAIPQLEQGDWSVLSKAHLAVVAPK